MVGDISRRLASQCRGHVSIGTSLDTEDGFTLRGRDPRVMGHPSPNHQLDAHRLSMFLFTPPWARGTNINPRVLHKPLPLHNQVEWTRAWVEVEARAHKSGLQGPRGMPMPSHLELSLQIIGYTGYIYALSLMGNSTILLWCISFIHCCIMCERFVLRG